MLFLALKYVRYTYGRKEESTALVWHRSSPSALVSEVPGRVNNQAQETKYYVNSSLFGG